MLVSKFLIPGIIIALWVYSSIRNGSTSYSMITLFFASVAAFSQNFEFVFRQVHQIIQFPMAIAGLFALVRLRISQPITTILTVFLFFILLSILFSSFDQDARVQFLNFGVSASVAAFLLMKFRTLSPTSKYDFSRFMVQLGFVTAVSGMYDYYVLGSPRAEGQFANPNYYALFIGVCYCFIFIKRVGFFEILAAASILLAIDASGSRSAIALPFAAHIWLIWKSEFIQNSLGRWLMTSLLIAVSFLSFFAFFDRADGVGSDAERTALIVLGWEMALDNPVTGVGWGRYATVFSEFAPSSALEILSSKSQIIIEGQERRVSHNDFVRVAAELGFPAALFFIVTVFVALQKSYTSTGYFKRSLFPIVFGMMLFSLMHNNLNTAMTWFFLMLPFLERRSFTPSTQLSAHFIRN